MTYAFLALLAGLIMLSLGADGLVRGAASLARRLGMTPLVIGLTVVAMGTSMPELMVSLGAALRGSADLALGNVIGSNIANIGLILGISALVTPLRVKTQVIRFDVPVLVGVSVVLFAILIGPVMDAVDGGLLVLGLVGYVGFNVWAARRERNRAVREEFDEEVPPQQPLWKDAVYLIGGLALLLGGAQLLVDGAIIIAENMGISQVVIGLTIVAVGTSLPELATSAVAAARSEGDIAVGNAIGSSIFNILGILGTTALVQPLATQNISGVDSGMMLGITVLLLPLMRTGYTLKRWEGMLLLGAYIGYVVYLF